MGSLWLSSINKQIPKKQSLTKTANGCNLYFEQLNNAFLLFRVVEIQRICEATATPEKEGANLSE